MGARGDSVAKRGDQVPQASGRRRWADYVNLAASITSLATLGAGLLFGGIVGRLSEIADILGQPWSSVAAFGAFLLAAAGTRFALARWTGGSTGAAEPNAVTTGLTNFSVELERWDPLLHQFGHDVLMFFCRQPEPTTPIPPSQLARRLRRELTAVSDMSESDVVRLLRDVHNRGHAPGLAKNDHGYFVPEDHMTFKLASHGESKRKIGLAAASLVESHSVVALDGGSTTLPIVRAMLERIDRDDLLDVTVVTNSYAIARAIADLIVKRGWSDGQSPVCVLMPAGTLRPNTLAISPLKRNPKLPVTSLKQIFRSTGPPSLCFVGANGLRADEGITMPTGFELAIKETMLDSTADPYVVADPSKFGVHNSVRIRAWSDELTLLTCRAEHIHQEMDAILNVEGRRARIVFAESILEAQERPAASWS